MLRDSSTMLKGHQRISTRHLNNIFSTGTLEVNDNAESFKSYDRRPQMNTGGTAEKMKQFTLNSRDNSVHSASLQKSAASGSLLSSFITSGQSGPFRIDIIQEEEQVPINEIVSQEEEKTPPT
mmetsp:Transcript_22205/g.34371  ORF Transcript_22205/g.34371 Transcript_22205/m.34371 type:complete len:123 (+) Transcript_22205:55-423(+)